MTKPASHDSYLSTLPEEKRAALQSLRERVAVIIPEAEEVISYAMPGFRIGKAVIVGYAAFKNHLGYFPHSGNIVPQFKPELDALGFTYTDGGFRFQPDKPIPDDLLTRLIAARRTETGV